MRFAVFERIWYLFERLAVSVQKKLLSVRTAWAIRLKKIVIRSNVQTAWEIRLKKLLGRRENPEHGTFRNIPEHEKLLFFFNEKIIN